MNLGPFDSKTPNRAIDVEGLQQMPKVGRNTVAASILLTEKSKSEKGQVQGEDSRSNPSLD
jgi:hypothetical protein